MLNLGSKPPLPSRARRARRRIESLSPKLTLSSDEDGGRVTTSTPIISADSTRVETEDRRRWCEVGRDLGPDVDIGRESLVDEESDIVEIIEFVDVENASEEDEPLRT